jgi:predicted DNA-binding transcriptional regulator AlpA
MNQIPEVGFVRLPTILKIIPISKSTWWEGIKTGRFPQPIKLGPRTTVWSVESIRALIAVHQVKDSEGVSK